MLTDTMFACPAAAGAADAATTEADLNQWLVGAEYAVRGEILDRSEVLQKQLDAGEKLPFEKIVACNIGNPQALGQKPLSFNRQVLSLVTNPDMLTDSSFKELYPPEVVERAEKYTSNIGGGIGAYTNSQGLSVVRQEVADFIEARDGVGPADPESIFLTDGASAGVRMVYTTMIDSSSGNDGLLVPIPQYPLYSALATLHNAHLVPYYLDEEHGWTLTGAEVERALAEAKTKGIKVRALAIINPGNPTGQCLEEKDMVDIVKVAAKEGLVLLADEVYQENVYVEDRNFISFRKVVKTMAASSDAAEAEAGKTVEMISFHSVSKGFIGECGIRGGYFELYNIDPVVKANLYKLASISLCSNTHGQLSVGLMVNPPPAGTKSDDMYQKEKAATLGSLKRRASKLEAALNSLPGMSCQPLTGSMYAFPSITLPAGALAAAKEAGKTADVFYALQVLENTGIVMVPGSGFGQKDGTWHFRTTFLPPESEMDGVIERLGAFHIGFMEKYSKEL
jgi:alanine transaminase